MTGGTSGGMEARSHKWDDKKIEGLKKKKEDLESELEKLGSIREMKLKESEASGKISGLEKQIQYTEIEKEEMMQMKSDSPQMTDKEILEKVLGRESVRLFGWGRSPSKSRATCAGKEPSRPTYSDVLDELNQYKSRVKELEGGYQMLCETLIEKNVIHPSQLPHVPSDHSSRPSHHGTTPVVDDSADYVGEFDDII